MGLLFVYEIIVGCVLASSAYGLTTLMQRVNTKLGEASGSKEVKTIEEPSLEEQLLTKALRYKEQDLTVAVWKERAKEVLRDRVEIREFFNEFQKEIVMLNKYLDLEKSASREAKDKVSELISKSIAEKLEQKKELSTIELLKELESFSSTDSK